MSGALRLSGGGRESRSNVLRNSGEWGTSGCTLFTYIGSMYLSWEHFNHTFFFNVSGFTHLPIVALRL